MKKKLPKVLSRQNRAYTGNCLIPVLCNFNHRSDAREGEKKRIPAMLMKGFFRESSNSIK